MSGSRSRKSSEAASEADSFRDVSSQYRMTSNQRIRLSAKGFQSTDVQSGEMQKSVVTLEKTNWLVKNKKSVGLVAKSGNNNKVAAAAIRDRNGNSNNRSSSAVDNARKPRHSIRESSAPRSRLQQSAEAGLQKDGNSLRSGVGKRKKSEASSFSSATSSSSSASSMSARFSSVQSLNSGNVGHGLRKTRPAAAVRAAASASSLRAESAAARRRPSQQMSGKATGESKPTSEPAPPKRRSSSSAIAAAKPRGGLLRCSADQPTQSRPKTAAVGVGAGSHRGGINGVSNKKRRDKKFEPGTVPKSRGGGGGGYYKKGERVDSCIELEEDSQKFPHKDRAEDSRKLSPPPSSHSRLHRVFEAERERQRLDNNGNCQEGDTCERQDIGGGGAQGLLGLSRLVSPDESKTQMTRVLENSSYNGRHGNLKEAATARDGGEDAAEKKVLPEFLIPPPPPPADPLGEEDAGQKKAISESVVANEKALEAVRVDSSSTCSSSLLLVKVIQEEVHFPAATIATVEDKEDQQVPDLFAQAVGACEEAVRVLELDNRTEEQRGYLSGRAGERYVL